VKFIDYRFIVIPFLLIAFYSCGPEGKGQLEQENGYDGVISDYLNRGYWNFIISPDIVHGAGTFWSISIPFRGIPAE